jgi:long-subunit fatty acid transport protein
MALSLASKFGIAASITSILAVAGTGITWDINEHLTLEKRFEAIQQNQQSTNAAVRVIASELTSQKQDLIERLLTAQKQELKEDASLHRQLKEKDQEILAAEKMNGTGFSFGHYAQQYAADAPAIPAQKGKTVPPVIY